MRGNFTLFSFFPTFPLELSSYINNKNQRRSKLTKTKKLELGIRGGFTKSYFKIEKYIISNFIKLDSSWVKGNF